MKTIITVSRYWNNPKILHVLWGDGISLSVDVEDFKKAIKEEIGSVRWVVRKSTFETMVDEAFKVVIDKIKEESAKVV